VGENFLPEPNAKAIKISRGDFSKRGKRSLIRGVEGRAIIRTREGPSGKSNPLRGRKRLFQRRRGEKKF